MRKSELKLEKALDFLVEKIRAGAEYPDAHFLACCKFDLSDTEGSRLSDLYDLMFCVPGEHEGDDEDDEGNKPQ